MTGGQEKRTHAVGAGYVELRLWVQPGASRDDWTKDQQRGLRVRLRARPQKGQANEALAIFLAKKLGVPKTQVEIVAGHKSRDKRVRVHGDPESIMAALREVLGTEAVDEGA